MSPGARVRATGLALALAGLPPAGARDEPAAGTRVAALHAELVGFGPPQVVAVEGGGQAAVVEVSGAVVLTNPGGLSLGFHGLAIGFDDGEGLSLGRSVWTDENGDRVFSRLRGEPLQTGRRVEGTSRAAPGATPASRANTPSPGNTSFPRRRDLVQGRAVGLSGRVRRAEEPR